MAQLVIGIGDNRELVFNFATVRTQSYETVPVLDASGQHYECTRITLDVIGIVNSVAIATNKNDAYSIGPERRADWGDPSKDGDALGVSMFNMRDLLMHPRRSVTYTVGDDVVLDLPRRKALAAKQGRPVLGPRYPCDARGGPFPERAVWTQIAGDKTAILSYRVTCYDNYSEQTLLSHAWSVGCSIDRHGYTTRVINGRATFRQDVMKDAGTEPDDFRRLLFHPVPPGMRRIGVEVEQGANAWEYYYTATDREVTIGLPDGGRVMEVTGSVTSSVVYPIRDPKSMVQSAIALVGTVGNAVKEIDVQGLMFNTANQAFVNYTPTQTNTGVARAYGQKDADRATLSLVALAFLLDRFTPALRDDQGAVGGAALGVLAFAGFGRGRIAAISLTHNVDTDQAPYAEARIEILCMNLSFIQAIAENNPNRTLKLDNKIQSNATVVASQGGPDWQSHRKGPALPASSGARGTSLVRMLTQALENPTRGRQPDEARLPADPQAAERSRDINQKV